MALHEFLTEHRAEILGLMTARIAQGSPGGTLLELEDSLPELYDQLVATLREEAGLPRLTGQTAAAKTATVHGRQRLRLGFSLEQLVHDYGAMCHAITEVAEHEGGITPHEYQVLNQVLDVAIAEAVSEYSRQRESDEGRASEQRASEHLSFVVHELRNAIGAVMLSFDAIRKGHVAVGGRTASVLERNLLRMQALIDRSLAEVRLSGRLELSLQPVTIGDLLEDVGMSIAFEAQSKDARWRVEGDLAAQVRIDRELMISAISNLVHNAIEYSPRGAGIHVRVRRHAAAGTIDIEVEDECGGLPEHQVHDLFTPSVRGGGRAPGLGLGLAISRRAVEAHGGRISARNLPQSKGCVFVVTLDEVQATRDHAAARSH